MDARLLPVNAVLGLLTPGDVNRPTLLESGFILAGLEVPIVGPDGRVDVDIVLFHPASGHLVLLEAKSGANIEEAQAARYLGLEAAAIVQATGVTVPRRDQLTFEVAYVCLAENAERIRQGLAAAKMTGGLVVVGDDSVTFERQDAPTSFDVVWQDGPIALAASIARVLPFDADSPVSEFDSAVRAQLVAELAHSRREVTVRLLTERVVPYFAIFAAGAQRRLVSKVRESVRGIVEADPDTYGYRPTTGTRQDDVVELRKTPETRDPRGRTQAYQAMYGRWRRPEETDPRQPDLLDLLAENADALVGANGEDDEAVGDLLSALDQEDPRDQEDDASREEEV